MSILLVADLHLDRWLSFGRDPLAAVPASTWQDLDALIVAGDLGDKPKVRWAPLLAHIGRYVPLDRVHVMPGNHDYYHHTLDDDARLAEIATTAGAHFAQQSDLRIAGRRLLCCTLWTDFELRGDRAASMIDARRMMNDYKYIRLKSQAYRRISPLDTARVHADHLAWFGRMLWEPFDGTTIVVSHHAPSRACIPTPAATVDPAYASDLEPFIRQHAPAIWVHGHTHIPCSITVGRTEVLCVSLGYPEEVAPEQVRDRMLAGWLREGATG